MFGVYPGGRRPIWGLSTRVGCKLLANPGGQRPICCKSKGSKAHLGQIQGGPQHISGHFGPILGPFRRSEPIFLAILLSTYFGVHSGAWRPIQGLSMGLQVHLATIHGGPRPMWVQRPVWGNPDGRSEAPIQGLSKRSISRAIEGSEKPFILKPESCDLLVTLQVLELKIYLSIRIDLRPPRKPTTTFSGSANRTNSL